MANATTAKGFIESMVGLDLAWKFGWGPLLEDINRVHTCLDSVSKRLALMSEQWVTCTGTHRETSRETLLSGTNSSFGGMPLALTTTVERSTTTTWIAGVKRKLSPYAFQHPNKLLLDAIRESLGLQWGSQRVWEAVPFSFVVDWFIPVQTFLEQFNGTSIDASYVISGQKWLTTKSVSHLKTTMSLNPNLLSYHRLLEEVGNRAVSHEGTFRSYDRSTSAPWTEPALYLPHLRLPSLRQWWTGMELLITRFKGLAR
jgi:hypothetical protein